MEKVEVQKEVAAVVVAGEAQRVRTPSVKESVEEICKKQKKWLVDSKSKGFEDRNGGGGGHACEYQLPVWSGPIHVSASFLILRSDNSSFLSWQT